MSALREVRVGARSLERFRGLVDDGSLDEALALGERMRGLLAKRVVWNVNSTAVGGGVAEMLPPLLAYTRALGIDTRWLVIHGNEDFFRVTKRLHHALHGAGGDGSELGERERRIYEETLRENAAELSEMTQAGDIVLLHDPQTAGLGPALAERGVHVVWRCHIGHDQPGSEVERGWRFLEPYLRVIPHYVFSREAYVPEFCDHGKSTIITPSIDPFSPKNQELPEEAIRTILVNTGLLEGPPPEPGDPAFVRDDGTPSRVSRCADVIRQGRPPGWETPLVVQVSRWDPLKDPVGVLRGFAQMIEDTPLRAELVLAGPNVKAVADDPEGAAVFEGVTAAWRELSHGVRGRIHLASLPTRDVQENAAIVNALQRHAAVVVQKSLHEGFGLTVTEAMWKGRPVLASAVGGIQDQIVDGESGVLLRNPADLDAFARLLAGLLRDPERAAQLGAAGRERVRKHFLGMGHLLRYARLFAEILS